MQISEARLNEAQKIAKLGSFEYDFQKDSLWWSDQTFHMTGFEKTDSPPTYETFIKRLQDPDDRKRLDYLVERAQKYGEDYSMTYSYQVPGEDLIFIDVEARVVFDNAGKPIGLKGTVHDVTEREKAQAERDELQTKLMQSQKMESIGNLAGGIAHEFNNMLAIMLGNNEIIIDELPDSGVIRESAEEIQNAGLRAKDVVKQLLMFSRQDNAVQERIDVRVAIQDPIKLIRSTTPANIKIEDYLPSGIYPIFGNATQINQILINLCNNAIDAVPDQGGLVKIELSNCTIDSSNSMNLSELETGCYVKLVVSDNGRGMENEILKRIFEPYYTTKAVGKGTGIGLAIVHGIVEQHRGMIEAESKVGEGAIFTIFFPAHEGVINDDIDEKTPLPIGDERILLVDDEPSLVKINERLLGSLGYNILSSTDPEKALAMVKNDPNSFDLIISDMAMPKMTGEHLIKEILKIRQDLPSIICTGHSERISEKKAMELGGSSLIMKPIDKTELARVVRKVLDKAK